MTRKERIKKMMQDSAEAESESACNTPTEKLTDEQISEDVERAAEAGSMILALTKGITCCPSCSELSLLMALASMMHYNESEPERAVGLLKSLMEQKTLMETVFSDTRIAVIPAEALMEQAPRDPKDIQ